MLQFIVHYSLHFIFPLILARVFFRKNWKKAYLIMVLSMIIDIDHLIASPVFDSNRCSIGFHPLHSFYAVIVYLLLFFVPKTRIVSTGLLFHILTDAIDCFWISAQCKECIMNETLQQIIALIQG